MLFFNVQSAEAVRALLKRSVTKLATEICPLDAALQRITAQEVRSPIDLPEFPRAVVDGYAVRAVDTFGASAGNPTYFRVTGEVLMGQPATLPVGPGETIRVATGGMIPPHADAVVMVEYTETAGPDLVEIFRAAAPGEGLVLPGDDLRAGDLIVPPGRRLRPQDLGACAGVGITEVPVFARPRVAVLPTGDEIVSPGVAPQPGQVRDINTTALCAALRQSGAEPRPYPVIRDEPERLRTAIEEALATTDLVLIAGGSSVGARDWTLEVLEQLPGAELLVHGVSIRPGKPVIIVSVGEKLLVGLPGNPVSALVVYEQFIHPYVRRLSGEDRTLPSGSRLQARLTRSYGSDPGKEDYVRVRVSEDETGYLAEPLLGKSTLMMTLVTADGIVVIPENVEGLEAGEPVEVELF